MNTLRPSFQAPLSPLRKLMVGVGAVMYGCIAWISGLHLLGPVHDAAPNSLRYRLYQFLLVEHGTFVAVFCAAYGLLAALAWRREIAASITRRGVLRVAALLGVLALLCLIAFVSTPGRR